MLRDMVPRDTAGIAFFPRSEFASMIVKPRIICLWLLSGLSGCSALPSAEPGRGVVGGDSVSMAQRASLPGRPVSRSDVIQQLGPPTIEFADLRLSAYAWVEHQRDWTLYVPHS